MPVSEFPIKRNALKNHDTVEIVYASGGPDYNQNKQYFYQYIVISQSSGDTVRVLSTPRYDFNYSSERKIFISDESTEQMDKIILENFGIKGSPPEKVIYKKEHDLALNKKIPTTTGIFAETSSTLINVDSVITHK